MAQLKKSADQSIEQYKARLENASNSWLLASPRRSGRIHRPFWIRSRESAEKRLRETCAEVLAGMGDTLRNACSAFQRFSAEEEEPRSPKRRSEFLRYARSAPLQVPLGVFANPAEFPGSAAFRYNAAHGESVVPQRLVSGFSEALSNVSALSWRRFPSLDNKPGFTHLTIHAVSAAE